MALNFPNSPSLGDIHNASNGLAYYFDGVKWISQGTFSTGVIHAEKLDNIASGFNGSLKTFDLEVDNSTIKPPNDQAVLISVNNVILEPTVAYQINVTTGQITFTVAPTNGHAFFGVVYSRIPLSNTVSNPIQLSNGDKGDITIANAGEVNEAYTIDANAITTAKIADDAVTSAKIADFAVHTNQINNNAINADKIADNAINSEHYADASIDTAHIGDSQITTAKIADANVTTAKIANDAVVTSSIGANAVSTAKLGNDSVTTAKIAADAITGAKIADDSIDSEHYIDGSIDTAHIADYQITSAKIADGTIVDADINASAAIQGTKINPNFGSQNIATSGTVTALSFAGDGSSLTNLPAGSGTFNTDVTFTGDSYNMVWDKSDNALEFVDDAKAIFGSGNDLIIYHDPNSSYIDNNTGHLFIRNNVDDDDGGNIYLQAKSGENGIIINDDGSIQLYYDNSMVAQTMSGGLSVTGNLDVSASIDVTGSLNLVNTGSATSLRIENSNADFLLQAGDAGSDGLHIYDMDNTAYRMTIANDGNVGIGNISPAKKLDVSGEIRATGILFGSDTAAANTMDDYEEGVFTPSLEFGGATTGITYSSMRGGSYVKIGRMVTVNFGFTLTSKGSASGDATIAGLPYAIEDLISATSAEASGVSSYWNDLVTNSANIVFIALGGTSELEIRNTVGAEDDTDTMVDSDFDNDSAIRGSITYFTAT